MKIIFGPYEYIHKSSKTENSAGILAALPPSLFPSLPPFLPFDIYVSISPIIHLLEIIPSSFFCFHEHYLTNVFKWSYKIWINIIFTGYFIFH